MTMTVNPKEGSLVKGGAYADWGREGQTDRGLLWKLKYIVKNR